MTTPDLQILLLGPPEIRWKGELFSIQRRIPRSMLFYLAAKGGMVTRNELVLLFWEDQSPEQARTRLRETLSRLRQMLPVADLIVTSNDLVGLDFTRLFVDQVEFDQLINKFGQLPWKIPVNDPLPAEVQRNLVSAGRLWRGSHYLAGADFPSSYDLDAWLTLTSQHYEQLYSQVFERLSCHFEAQNDWDQAIRYVEKALENDHLNEDLHLRLLTLLRSSGKPERARQYYAQIEMLFLQELGTTPGERFKDILAHLQLVQPSRPPFQLPQSLQPRQIIDAPFVGRQQVLAQLWQCYQKKTSIFLSGEIGIGKTRLVQEFLQRNHPTAIVICTRCLPGEQQNPFQSSVDAEREYGYMRQIIGRIPIIYARQLARVLPEVAAVRPDLVDDATSSAIPDKMLALDAWRHFLMAITESQPGFFVIEDIQNMDMGTLEVIDYVIKRAPFGSKAMLVLTGREDECPPAMLKTIHSWMAAGHILHIELERLGLSDVYNLACEVLPTAPSSEFVAQLAADTGGNPYFVLEILRQAISEDPNLDVSKALPLPLSTQLAVIIRGRIAALSPEARQIFETAAIIGTEFDPEIVRQALAIDYITFEHAIGELVARDLIAMRPDTSGLCYYFPQEKVRQILLAELSPMQTRARHQRVAETMTAMFGERFPRSRLAWHTEKAGDLVKAFENWLQAALDALKAHQLADAQHFFEHAQHLIEPAWGMISAEAIGRLYRPWLNTIMAQEDIPNYQKVCDQLLDLSERTGSSLLKGMALNGQGWLHLHRYDMEAGLPVARQALLYLEQVGNSGEYLSAHNLYGTLLYMTNQLDEAMHMFQRAAMIAESIEISSPEIVTERGSTHENVSLLYQIRGWPTRSLQHAQNALADAIGSQNLFSQSTAYGYLAFAAYYLGEYAQALLYKDNGYRLAQQINYKLQIGFHQLYTAWITLAMGDLSASLQHTYAAYSCGEKAQNFLIMGLSERSFADIYQALRMPEMAMKHYQQALTYYPESIARLDVLFRVGFTHTRLEQYQQAHDILQHCILKSKQVGAELILCQSQISFAGLLFKQQEYEAARQIAEQYYAEAVQRSLMKERITAQFLLGEIARQTYDLDTAQRNFQEVAELSALRSHPWDEIRARLMLGKVFGGQDWPVEAQDSRVQALLNQMESSIAESDFLPGGQSLKEVFQNYRNSLPKLCD